MRWSWLALVVSLAQTPAPAPPVASSDLVRIDVVTRDAQGRTVENLTPSDFELREDGTPQPLADVQLVRGNPQHIAIYLDDYYVSPSNTAAVRASLHRFVDTQLAAADLVTILRPLDSLLTIKLTLDRASLHRQIDAFEGRRGDYEPRTAFERSYLVTDRGRADEQRAQSTWSTLNAMTLHLANLGAGRSTVLLVSEQADPVMQQRGLEGLPSSTSVTRTANRANVSVYVFDPRDAAARAAGLGEGPNLLRVLADDTDGALFTGVETIDAGLRKMLDDASSYYLVSYHSARNRDGLFHAVGVTVKRPGVKVSARKGYWAPTPDEIDRARRLTSGGATLPPIKLEPPRHVSTLIRPWFGIARGDSGKVRMTFVWEPSGPALGDRRARIPARLVMKAIGSDGATVFQGAVNDRSSAVFDVLPGRVTFTSSVEDASTQTIDSDVRDVQVRDLKGAVVLGTPEVFRARTARDVREIRDGASAVPAAAREFSRAEQLLIRVPVYAAEAAPTLSAALVSPAGQVMRQLAVEPEAIPQIDLPLAGLAPGQYSLEISATSAEGSAKETVAFRVTN